MATSSKAESDDEHYRARFARRPSPLAYRRSVEHPERIALIEPATRAEGAGDQRSPGRERPNGPRDLLRDETDVLLEELVGHVTRAIAAKWGPVLDAGREQLAIFESVLRSVDEGLGAEPFVTEFAWDQTAAAITLALFDDLADGDTVELLTGLSWATRCHRHIDIDNFMSVVDLGTKDVAEAMTIGAEAIVDAIVDRIGPAELLGLRYRDRWLRVGAFRDGLVPAIYARAFLPVLSAVVASPSTVIALRPMRLEQGEATLHFIFDTGSGVEREVTLAASPSAVHLEGDAVLVDSGLDTPESSGVVWVEADGRRVAFADVDSDEMPRDLDPLGSFEVRSTVDGVDHDCRCAGVTYISSDREGVLAALTAEMAERGIDVVGATEASLGDSAAFAFLLELPEALPASSVENLLTRLPDDAKEGRRSVLADAIRDTSSVTPFVSVPPGLATGNSRFWNVRVETADRVGLLLAFSSAVAHFGGVVVRSTSRTAPSLFGPRFEVFMMIVLPARANVFALHSSLQAQLPDDSPISVDYAASDLDYREAAPAASRSLEEAELVSVQALVRPGLLASVCRSLAERRCNVVASAVSVVHGYWTAIFAVVAEDAKENVNKALEALELEEHLWSETLGRVRASARADAGIVGVEADVRFTTPERPGVLATVAAALETWGCNVRTVHLTRRDDVAPPVGAIRMTVRASEAVVDDLDRKVRELQREKRWLGASSQRLEH